MRNFSVWNKTDGRCWYCGKHLVEPTDENREQIKDWFVADHIIPASQGGADDLGNLVASCWSCNCSKNNKSLEEFRAHVETQKSRQAFGTPYFTPDQVDWLEQNGFEIPTVGRQIFWGEKFGIDIYTGE